MTLLVAAINWHTFFFMFFALMACIFAVMVLISGNIVRMALYLIVSLGATSGLFFLAGAEFVGAMQLMIYVGGTLVLLIFGVMLTAQEAFVSMKIGGGEWVMAGGIGGALLVVLLFAAASVDDWKAPTTEYQQSVSREDVEDTTRIGQALMGIHPEKMDEKMDEKRRDGLSGYLLPFEIASVHLLVVLIGAGYMARTKKRRDQETD